MLVTIMIGAIVPVAAGAVLLVTRNHFPKLAADFRGIALQTVIIMVVLLAIAGAVAGVLLTRGGEAVSEIERTDITREANAYNGSKALCLAAGYKYTDSNSTCTT